MKTVTESVLHRSTVVVMTQTRLSISINQEIAAQIRQLATATGTTVSGWLERIAAKEIDRGKRTRELLAQWNAEDEEIFTKAAAMTYEELWRDTPPLSEAEAQELHTQLDRIETRWRAENS